MHFGGSDPVAFDLEAVKWAVLLKKDVLVPNSFFSWFSAFDFLTPSTGYGREAHRTMCSSWVPCSSDFCVKLADIQGPPLLRNLQYVPKYPRTEPPSPPYKKSGSLSRKLRTMAMI